ncbi:MAG TPA: class I SAM-dependent methyltransferase [Ktedonobacteraceae bacterium]|nr:class I SAM-dependent methyltransferase [Ktedonobacteraceae bacterium]
MMDENTYFIDKDDEAELARLLVQDNAYNLALTLLPTEWVFKSEMRVLDLACGPGGWVLQVSYDHPELSVIGVDLSPQMITYARAQAEVRELSAQFRIMDLLRVPWPFPDQHFDMLKARFITSLTPKAFLPTLYQECWRVLRPGGVLRYTEGSFVSTPTSAATQKLSLLSCEAAYRAGLSASPYEMGMAPITASILKKVGFKHVSLTPHLIDFSSGEPMYRLMKENWFMSIGLLKPFVVRMGVASPEEIDALQKDFAHDWNDSAFCGHYHVCSLVCFKDA